MFILIYVLPDILTPSQACRGPARRVSLTHVHGGGVET